MAADSATRFDRDTALEPVDGGFEARIDPGWWIVDGPNGGYLAAILLRAALLVSDPGRSPLVITTHYVSRLREGPALVEARVVREGRSVSTVTATMVQEGRPCCLATVALSTPRTGVAAFSDLGMPPVPGPDVLEPPPPGMIDIPINGRYERRPAVGNAPFTGGDRAEAGGWIRTEDARQVDALLVAALADAWFPAVFSRMEGRGTTVPTVELSVYFRGGLPRPAGEWALVHFASRHAAAGAVEEDGEIWSDDGALLAQSRQLALLTPNAP